MAGGARVASSWSDRIPLAVAVPTASFCVDAPESLARGRDHAPSVVWRAACGDARAPPGLAGRYLQRPLLPPHRDRPNPGGHGAPALLGEEKSPRAAFVPAESPIEGEITMWPAAVVYVLSSNQQREALKRERHTRRVVPNGRARRGRGSSGIDA